MARGFWADRVFFGYEEPDGTEGTIGDSDVNRIWFDLENGLIKGSTARSQGAWQIVGVITPVVREEMVAQWPAKSLVLTTTYSDVFSGAGEAGFPIPITVIAKRQVRLRVFWTKAGTGVQSIRVVRVSNGAVLVELTNLITGGNDSGLVDIPAQFLGEDFSVKLQVRSTVALDAPTLNSAVLTLR